MPADRLQEPAEARADAERQQQEDQVADDREQRGPIVGLSAHRVLPAVQSTRKSGEQILEGLRAMDLAAAAEDLDLDLAALEQLDLPTLPRYARPARYRSKRLSDRSLPIVL
jgi:hypothetical protein